MDNKAELGNGEFRIFTISEIGGGTRYMFGDGLIGLAQIFKSMSENEKPDMFVISGGVLPEIPTKGGPRNDDRLRVLIDGVQDFSGAAAVVEPHMERLFSVLPTTTEIVYVMGSSDRINKESIKDYYNLLYSKVKETIKKNGELNLFTLSVKEIKTDINSREEMLKATREGIVQFEAQLASANNQEERDRVFIDLGKAKASFKLNKERIHELEEKRVLFGKLEEIIKNAVGPDDWQKLIDSTRKQLSAVTAKRKKLNKVKKEKETAEQASKRMAKDAQLQSEAKTLSNKLKQLQHRLRESIDRNVTDDRDSRLGSINRHNHRTPTPKDATDIIDRIVEIEYMTHIRDAFGRKREIRIQEDTTDIYQKRVGSFNFSVVLRNVLAQESRTAYNIGSNDNVPVKFYEEFQDGGRRKEIESTGLTVVVEGGHGHTSFAMDLLQDQDPGIMAVLVKGPFLDKKVVSKLFTKGVITTITSGSRQKIDVCASEITIHGDGGLEHRIIGAEVFRDERIKSDKKEAEKLEEIVTKVREGTGVPVGGENSELSRAIAKSFRISELPDTITPFLDEQLVKALVPYLDAADPQKLREVTMALFNDIHMGHYTDLDLLEASVADAIKKKPDVLVFGGDNLDGKLRGQHDEARPENILYNMVMYEKWLKAQGFDELNVLRILEDRRKKQDINEILNVDAQAKALIDRMAPLIIDVIRRGGNIVLVSGNHYNGSLPNDSTRDEATVLDGAVKLFLMGQEGLPQDWEDHIKTVRGGKSVAEPFKLEVAPAEGEEEQIRYSTDISIRHALAASFRGMVGLVNRKRSKDALTVFGDKHSIRGVLTGEQLIVEGQSMQRTGTSPYVKTLGVPTTIEDPLAGYTSLKLKIKGENIVESVQQPVGRAQLVRRDWDTLWARFQKETSTIKVKAMA